MSSTKIYGYSGYSSPKFVMPVDLAMHTQTNPRVSRLLGISTFSPSALNMPSQELHSPSTPSPTSSLSSFSSGSLISSFSPPGRGSPRRKKRVVFADDKGLSLTSVRIFNTNLPERETEDAPHPEEKVKVAERPSTQTGKIRVKLGFPQPCPDRASLMENLVQLESCAVTEKTLSGSVRVCKVMFDKTVFIHITFDSWRSRQNIACTYVKEQKGALESDLFAFNIPLPSEMDPAKQVEFLVVFQSDKTGEQRLDNNKGKNYQISVENVTSEFSRFFTPSRRSFILPSPQRLVVWPVTRSHDLHIARYQPCKGPPYTQRMLHRSWGSMTNVTGLC